MTPIVAAVRALALAAVAVFSASGITSALGGLKGHGQPRIRRYDASAANSRHIRQSSARLRAR